MFIHPQFERREGSGWFRHFCGVSERTREGSNLCHEMIETGVISLEGDPKVALVFGPDERAPASGAMLVLL